MENEIIFTTAFKEINRENWKSYQVSTGRYIDYFIDCHCKTPFSKYETLIHKIKNLILK